jgi:hypothetical protein
MFDIYLINIVNYYYILINFEGGDVWMSIFRLLSEKEDLAFIMSLKSVYI